MDSKTAIDVLNKMLLTDKLLFEKKEAIKKAIEVLKKDAYKGDTK